MKHRINLQLFADGGEGAEGAQGAASGNAETGNGGSKSAGYSFEQAEEIANARAERAEKAALSSFFKQQGMDEAEITAAIAKYKADKAAAQPNVDAITKERDEARRELEALKNAQTLRDSGVKPDDLDYVAFKVAQLVDEKTDFAAAAAKFLKDNPRYNGKQAYTVHTGTANGGEGAGAENNNDTINAAIRKAANRRNLL